MLKKYHWQGINPAGLKIKGYTFSNTKAEVAVILKNQQIVPLAITHKITLSSFNLPTKISTEKINHFTQELAILTNAGISIASALAILTNHSEKNAFASLTKSLQRQVEGGKSLSEALKQHKNHFGEITCNLIYLGEQSGNLATILTHISQYQEKNRLLLQKIKKSLFYPTMVLTFSLLISALLLVYVIPKFSHLFKSLGANLPQFTQLMINFSHSIKCYGVHGLLAIFATIVIIKTMQKRSAKLRLLKDSLSLKLPLLRKILIYSIFSRLFNSLALGLDSGLPLIEAMAITANVIGNTVYQLNVTKLSKHIVSGDSLHTALLKEPLFPDRVAKMIAIGEETGCLSQMLKKLGEYYTQQLDQIIENLNQFLEPAIMVFLCIVIGSIVIAIYLPIFQLGHII